MPFDDPMQHPPMLPEEHAPPPEGISPVGMMPGQAEAPPPRPGDTDPDPQKHYDMLVSSALEFIHGEESGETVLETLRLHETPAEGIAEVLSMLGAGLKRAADEANATLDPEAWLAAATEIIESLLELGQAAGIFQFQSQEEIDAAAQEALLLATQEFGQALLAAPEGDNLRAQAAQQVQDEVAKEQQQVAPPEPMGLLGQGQARLPGGEQDPSGY